MSPLIRKVDAVTVPVPDLDDGLRFYRDALGHDVLWRNDEAGQAGLGLPDSDTEIVLTTRQRYEPDWLVTSTDEAATSSSSTSPRVVTRPTRQGRSPGLRGIGDRGHRVVHRQ